jgi:hypothetical protein
MCGLWSTLTRFKNVDWVEPIDDSKEAKDAAQLNLDWVVGLVSSPSNSEIVL